MALPPRPSSEQPPASTPGTSEDDSELDLSGFEIKSWAEAQRLISWFEDTYADAPISKNPGFAHLVRSMRRDLSLHLGRRRVDKRIAVTKMHGRTRTRANLRVGRPGGASRSSSRGGDSGDPDLADPEPPRPALLRVLLAAHEGSR